MAWQLQWLKWYGLGSVQRELAVRLRSQLVGLYTKSTIQMCVALMHKPTAEISANVPYSAVILIFVQLEYILSGYTPKVSNVYLQNGFIRDPCKHVKRLQQTLNSFGVFAKKGSKIVLVAGGAEECGGHWAEKVLVMFRTSVRGANQSQDYLFVQYLKMIGPIDVADETLRCVCFQRSTDNAVDHSLG